MATDIEMLVGTAIRDQLRPERRGSPLWNDHDIYEYLHMAREAIRTIVAEVDKSPAVTWAGKGGVKELLRVDDD